MAELTDALKRIDKIPNAWVRLGLVVPDSRNLGLLFNILEGKRGPIVQHCRVRCLRVREWHVDDLDGGGIRLYGSDHPLARQYSSAKARLRLERVEDAGAAIAALATAHAQLFDDWVPIEQYLGSLADLPARVAAGLSVTGPEFVLKAYARALRPTRQLLEASGKAERHRSFQDPAFLAIFRRRRAVRSRSDERGRVRSLKPATG